METMKQEKNSAVILYDGWCQLCSASVRFVIRHDSRKIFRFAPLQSVAGEILTGKNLPMKQVPDSIVYIEDGKPFMKSEAILRILKKMGRGWQVFYPLHFIPVFLRDGIYDWIARIRYKVFGRRTSCHLLPPGREYTP